MVHTHWVLGKGRIHSWAEIEIGIGDLPLTDPVTAIEEDRLIEPKKTTMPADPCQDKSQRHRGRQQHQIEHLILCMEAIQKISSLRWLMKMAHDAPNSLMSIDIGYPPIVI